MIDVKANKNRALSFVQIKDTVILATGSFGLSFMLSVYALTIPRLLIENHVPSALINIFVFSELLFFALFSPFFSYLFDITRTAIGRRTPYLITFGIASAFLVTFIQKNPDGSLMSVLSVILLFNFSLFLYSISFFGLALDKTTYQMKFLLPFHLIFSGFLGVILSYFYMMNSENIELGIETPVSGFIFLLSALAVSFFIIEDKKYKTKLSKTERREYNFKLKNLFNLSGFEKSDLIKLIILGIVYSHEIFIAELLSSTSFRKIVFGQLLFVTAVGLSYCLCIFSKKISEFSEKSRSVLLIVLSLLYFLYSFSSVSTILFLQFLVGLLWGLIIPKVIGFIIPSRSERILFYKESFEESSNKPKENNLRLALFEFIILSILGFITSIIGSRNVNLIYSLVALCLFILSLSKKLSVSKGSENI